MWFRGAEGNELFVLTSRPEDLVQFSGQYKLHSVIGQKICFVYILSFILQATNQNKTTKNMRIQASLFKIQCTDTESNGREIKENILPLNHQHLIENNHLPYFLYLN